MSTNALTEVRERLTALLKDAGLHPFAVIPEKVQPPLTYVSPGDPYVSREGASFGGAVIVRCNVGAVAGKGVSDVAAASVDELVLKVIDALVVDPEFVVGDVSQPGQIPINGNTYLGASVEVLIEITRS